MSALVTSAAIVNQDITRYALRGIDRNGNPDSGPLDNTASFNANYSGGGIVATYIAVLSVTTADDTNATAQDNVYAV